MIIKKIPKKKAGQSSFKNLSNYMLDERNGRQKVEEYNFTNCSFENIEENILEIENTQAINTKTKSDKTYHMVVSFQSDENPTPEMMREIEDELVRSIGMEKHQRLSVVHGNTNNLHIHIAINKIDPELHRCVEPFQDMPKLHKKATELEKRLGLKIDNHIPNKEKENERSPQEIHTGVESFKTWIKEEVAGSVKKILEEGGTWEELHKVLGEYDLELVERGNGMVISSRSSKYHIKASDVSRDLSKGKLEKKLGEFKKPVERTEAKVKFGSRSKAKNEYWDEYKKQADQNKVQKILLIEELKKQTAKEKLVILTTAKHEKGEVQRHKYLDREEKLKKYKEISKKKRDSLTQLYTKDRTSKAEIYNEVRHTSYKDFLIEKAITGDLKALDLLDHGKNKKAEPIKDANIIIGEDFKPVIDTKKAPTITKSGDIVYKLDRDTKIMDQGTSIKTTVLKKESQYLQTLLLAKEKFGKELDVQGTDEFKKQMVIVTIKYGVDVKFKDPVMEKLRLLPKTREIEKEWLPTKKIGLEAEKTKTKIEELYNGKPRKLAESNDKGRWDAYFESSRAYIRDATSKLENALRDFRNIGSTGTETIRERIADVFPRKDREFGKKLQIGTDSNTRATTDRERNEALQPNDGKSIKDDRLMDKTKSKGIGR